MSETINWNFRWKSHIITVWKINIDIWSSIEGHSPETFKVGSHNLSAKQNFPMGKITIIQEYIISKYSHTNLTLFEGHFGYFKQNHYLLMKIRLILLKPEVKQCFCFQFGNDTAFPRVTKALENRIKKTSRPFRWSDQIKSSTFLVASFDDFAIENFVSIDYLLYHTLDGFQIIFEAFPMLVRSKSHTLDSIVIERVIFFYLLNYS